MNQRCVCWGSTGGGVFEVDYGMCNKNSLSGYWIWGLIPTCQYCSYLVRPLCIQVAQTHGRDSQEGV